MGKNEMLGGTSPQSPSLKLPHFLISYNTRVFENNERYLVSIMVLFMHAVSSTTICIFYAWGIVRTLKMKFLLTTVFAWVQLSDAADWQKAGFSKCSQDNVVREPSNSDWGQRWVQRSWTWAGLSTSEMRKKEETEKTFQKSTMRKAQRCWHPSVALLAA